MQSHDGLIGQVHGRICCELGRSETGCYPHVLYRGCTRVQSRVGLSTPFQLSEENPKNICILMPMYTGTRLTTAIHRRLSPRYFLRGGGLCTQATVQQILILKFAFGPEYFPGLSRNRPGPGTSLNTRDTPLTGRTPGTLSVTKIRQKKYKTKKNSK